MFYSCKTQLKEKKFLLFMGRPSCHLCNKKLSFDFFLQNEGAQIHSIFPENRLTRKLETILQHSAEVALPWGNNARQGRRVTWESATQCLISDYDGDFLLVIKTLLEARTRSPDIPLLRCSIKYFWIQKYHTFSSQHEYNYICLEPCSPYTYTNK